MANAAQQRIDLDPLSPLPLQPSSFGYRWVILGLCFLNQGLNYGIWYVFPVFFVAMLDDFGWARGPAAAVFSAFVLVNGVVAPLVGGLTDRYGPRVIIPVGSAIIGLALVGCAYVTELWQFYFWYGLVGGIGVGLGGWISNAAILSRWFPRSVGSAAGFSSAGIGMVILLLVPAAQALISSIGWREAYLWLAGLTILAVPANLLLQRRPPEHAPDAAVRVRTDRSTATTEASPPRAAFDDLVADPDWAGRIWTLRQAAGTARFWLLFACFFMTSFSVQLILVHEVAFLVDSGWDRALAATTAGLIGLVSIPAKLVGGPLSDRFGREPTWTAYLVVLVLGLAVLIVAGVGPRPELAYVFPILIGIGYSVMAPMAPAMAADIFKGPNFGAIFGAIAASNGIGAAVGAWTAGALYDVTGSYMAAFAGATIAAALSAACAWLAAPRHVRRTSGARLAPVSVRDLRPARS